MSTASLSAHGDKLCPSAILVCIVEEFYEASPSVQYQSAPNSVNPRKSVYKQTQCKESVAQFVCKQFWGIPTWKK